MTNEVALWTGDDGRSFGWSTDTGVVAMLAADDTDVTLDGRQAELERLFARPALVPVSEVGPGGEIIETFQEEDPGSLEHAAAVARSVGARRRL